MKIDWKRKLASRKLWLAVAGFVTSLYVLITSDVTAEKITALIVNFGSVFSYIFAEGWVDKTNVTPFIEAEDYEDIKAEDYKE